ncbi:conserved virulence factor C family protein [Aquibacillus rhizosphaerae]|uniref:Conserved virulence factor C family protein n=1 Tax=Aquibacillus rhizosphaerae TaxID=3051431 RepID=A0ABT7L0K2_9BACI|nr:conserved virulence factor C family protein [Aquibacillus sp. LR5S19]MDL4839341.1 conserved virulence factor C family protein [Aquibacillus sp. LR5S19]
MKIISIEPTPSPHSMKINLNETLPDNQTMNYKQGDDLSSAPTYIQSLFEIEGVKGIYQVVDFIALERHPKVAWEVILPEVRRTLGSEEANLHEITNVKMVQPSDEAFGEVKVLIQMFRNIPMQVKLDDGNEEKRFGLPKIFMNATMEASAASPNFVMERKWVEQRPRYGALEEIGNDIVDELSASYDQDRLNQLVKIALDNNSESAIEKAAPEEQTPLSVLDHEDWKVRYAALDHMEPSYEKLPFLAKALNDEKASIRRLATAYLGMIEEPEVLPYLYKALKDNAVTVRRTAGDCLSDLGFKEAMPEMIVSLKDPNRLVRWRAAMFLYEIGDRTAIEALTSAANDPEFEVRMQVNMALERIEGGEAAKGSVWHQMTQATKKKSK